MSNYAIQNLFQFLEKHGTCPGGSFDVQQSYRFVKSVIPGTSRIFASNFKGDTTTFVQSIIEKQNNQPFQWVVTNADQPPTLGEILEKHNFKLVANSRIMICELSSWQNISEKHNSDISFHDVNEACDLQDWINVATCAYPFGDKNAETATKLITHLSSLECFKFHLIRVDGKSVGTAASFCKDGCVGLYWGATLPSYRGRGLCSSQQIHLLERFKKQGIERITLQASPASTGLNLKVGFKETGWMRMYNYIGTPNE